MLGLGLAVLTGLAGCGGSGVAPSPRPPQQVTMVYESGARPADPIDGWIWQSDVTGRNAERLTPGQSPVLSPDGRFVAFSRYRAKPSIWYAMVMDLSSRATRQIFARKGDYAHATSSLTWSPDSSVLALVDEQGITVVDRDTGQIPQTIASSTYLGTPSFSPDSRQITYADDASGRVFVASATGGHPSPITMGPHDFGPVWGPTGIAFARWLAAGKPGDIWLAQANGEGPRRLTHTDAGIQPVAFSADGLNLIAQNPASHNGRIWAVDVSTGSARDLTGWVGDLFPQGVSRDGTSILVGIGCGGVPSATGTIEVIPTSGGPARTITRGPCRASWNA